MGVWSRLAASRFSRSITSLQNDIKDVEKRVKVRARILRVLLRSDLLTDA